MVTIWYLMRFKVDIAQTYDLMNFIHTKWLTNIEYFNVTMENPFFIAFFCKSNRNPI